MQDYTLKKKTLFFLITLFIGIIFVSTIFEIYIRLFSKYGYTNPETLKRKSLQYSPSIFSRHVFPQMELTAEGVDNVKYYINEKGYRGHNFTVDKPEGTTRIIFYGGSAVFDIHLPEEKDWPHRIENILRQRGFLKIEVINAGIPGHASFDSFGRLFAEGHIFSPDYVVLYNAWNDIKYFQSEKSLLRQIKPFNESKDPLTNYKNSIDKFLCKFSQLYVRIRYRYYVWKHKIGLEGRRISKKRIKEHSLKIKGFNLKQYRVNIESFVDLARNIGAIPILMTQARLVARDNIKKQKKRISYHYQNLSHQELCEAFEKTDEIIQQIANKKNVILIDTSKYLTGRDELYQDHVHLNDKGAEEIAHLTARHIIKFLKKGK